MKDLRSQLAARFGAPDPATAAPPPPPPKDLGILGPEAHLATPWIAALRKLRDLPDPGRLADKPSLGNARQHTDKAIKALKKLNRTREAEELDDLRSRFLDKRQKEAWAQMKERFGALDLSERAYRAVKQSDVDAVVALERLQKLDEPTLKSLGADKLRDILLGKATP